MYLKVVHVTLAPPYHFKPAKGQPEAGPALDQKARTASGTPEFLDQATPSHDGDLRTHARNTTAIVIDSPNRGWSDDELIPPTSDI